MKNVPRPRRKYTSLDFVFLCSSLSAQSSKTSSFSQDIENNQELIDCGPAGMHRKSIEAAEHLKSGGEDSGNDHNGSGSSPHHNHHQGGPTSSESGQESQDGMGPSSSTGRKLSMTFIDSLVFRASYYPLILLPASLLIRKPIASYGSTINFPTIPLLPTSLSLSLSNGNWN